MKHCWMLTLSCGMTASTLFTSHSDCSTCISPPLLLLPPQQSEFIIGASLMLCGHQPHHPAHAPTHHLTLSSTSNPSGSRSSCFPDAAWFGVIRMGFAVSLTKLRNLSIPALGVGGLARQGASCASVQYVQTHHHFFTATLSPFFYAQCPHLPLLC